MRLKYTYTLYQPTLTQGTRGNMFYYDNNTGCAKKNWTKVVGYNFACVGSFMKKF